MAQENIEPAIKSDDFYSICTEYFAALRKQGRQDNALKMSFFTHCQQFQTKSYSEKVDIS